MVGFGAASAFGGLAQSGTELIIARGLQGAFAALLAPAALALLTVTFPSGKERGTAFAVFGTIAGAGAAVGYILGGVLTEFADWRWCLLVNVFFVVAAFIGGILLVGESKAEGNNKYDIIGTITATLGLGALVYGFSLAEGGWGAPNTLGFLALGVGLLTLFVYVETQVEQPLLPLRILLDRTRSGALLIYAVSGSVMIGATLYLAFHLQIVLGMSPLQAGLANLPMTASILLVAPLAAKLVRMIGAKPLMIAGPLFVAAGLSYLSAITATGDYFVQVLPGLIVMGVGMALIFIPIQNLALTGVASHDAGVASALLSSAMQIGGSIGLSVFTALYANTVKSAEAVDGAAPFASLASGYSTVFIAAAIGMVGASIIAALFLRSKKNTLETSEPIGALMAH